MSTEGTGATTRLCLSPGFVWSRPCICRRNAPPSCWTWRSSRWCSRCRRRRCRPCVGCTWPACLSCESQKVSCVSGGFGEAPLAAFSQKIKQKPGRFGGKGIWICHARWQMETQRYERSDRPTSKFPVWFAPMSSEILCASHAGKVRPCLMPHSHICNTSLRLCQVTTTNY